MRMHSGRWYRVMGFLGHSALNVVLVAASLACLLPFWLVLVASFSTDKSIVNYGYGLWPREFSTLAYRWVLTDPSRLLQAYGVSLTVSVGGGSLSLLAMALMAYAISRPRFQFRQPLAFYLFFTLLFSGGLVPSYILITRYLHLKDTLWVLILPALINPWWVLVLRTFFKELPEELLDAAKIDGAGEWRLCFQIAIPLTKPGLATIALFTMLSYWNDWFTALLYIDDRRLLPVQYLLYVILRKVDLAPGAPPPGPEQVQIPALPLRMAMAVFGIGPIALAYLFVQKYFIRGIRLGSLKG